MGGFKRTVKLDAQDAVPFWAMQRSDVVGQRECRPLDCAHGSGGRAIPGGFECGGGASVFLVEQCPTRPRGSFGRAASAATGGAVRVTVLAILMPIFELNQLVK
jgi:hypothetical protein